MILATTWENSHTEMAQKTPPGAGRVLWSSATSFNTPSSYHALPEDEDHIPPHKQLLSQMVVEGEGIAGTVEVKE